MSDSRLWERTLSSEELYSGKIVKLHVDRALTPSGKTAKREVVLHPAGVCVAAVDDERRVYMVRQFRYPFGAILTELPAGKLDPNENPDDAARRELKEETGLTAQKLKKLAVSYPSPGFCDEQLYLYIATGLERGESCPDEDEFLDVFTVPLDDAAAMVERGEIKDAKTQTLLLLAQRLLNKDRE